MERLRIGELLVRAKLVTPEQLEDALTLQRAQGRKLGQVLIDLAIVNETQLTQTLGQQLSVPWVSLYHIDFSRQLLNLVPREVAERYCLIPIFVRRVRNQGETLYVAMDDPTNEAALEAVRVAAALPARPMIAAPSEIRGAIRVYYDPGESESLPPTGPEVPGSPMTVRSSSSQAGPSAPRSPPPPPRPDAASPVDEPPNSRVVIAEGASPPSSSQPFAPPPESAPVPSSQRNPSEVDSPDAWPEVETGTFELPLRKGGRKMVALTLLDGTAIQVPAKPRRTDDGGSAVSRRLTGAAPESLENMTARDMIKALDSVADGADAQQVFGVKAPVETIVSSLLSVLLRKGLIADWEFVEEVRKRRK